MRRLWLACLGLAVAAISVTSPARAEMKEIERKIRKEPAYGSKNPKYCLLAFGPKAGTRIWLVLDGDAFYIDHNGNGDLTEPFKRIPIEQKIEEKTDDGTFLKTPMFEEKVTDRGQQRRFDVSFEHSADYRQTGCSVALREEKLPRLCWAEMADSPEQATILRLDGPLTLQLAEDEPILVRGDKTRDLCVSVGTFGDKFNALILNKAVPPDMHPIAEIEFPSKEVGGKPINIKVELSRRC
jgi:hypothetical protein